MAKRGPKPFDETSDRLMPTHVIAQKLGVSKRTVDYDLERAFNRLRFALALYVLFMGGVR